jgi:hypothetical protein
LGGTVCQKHGGGAPQVKAKAKERLLAERAVQEFGLAAARDPERVLSEVGCIAFVRAGDLYDEQGRMLPIKQLPAHVQAAVAQQETLRGNLDQGDGRSDRLVRVRFVDKARMLEMLAKHHGLLKERVNVAARVVYKWQD